MLYTLYLKDNPVLDIDFDEYYLNVKNNDLLPYPMKDFIKTSGEKDFKGSMHDLTIVRDYFSSRTINLSRENAKAILNSTSLPQTLKTEDRLKIVLACKGLTMHDNYWLKSENDTKYFNEVCLRKHKLSEVSYDIAILGKTISATAEELTPDLMTIGMFPKYWHRTNEDIELWKTDKIDGKINTLSEIKASRILSEAGENVVKYRKEEKNEMIFSVCKCIADDDISLISAQDVMDWCRHTGQDIIKDIIAKDETMKQSFINMCISDYVVANTDRHSENWNFLIDNNNNIIGIAPLLDFNQALIADIMNVDIKDQIYEPTGISFMETIKKLSFKTTLNFDKINELPEKVKERWNIVKKYAEQNRGEQKAESRKINCHLDR